MGNKRLSKNKIYIADTESRTPKAMEEMNLSEVNVYLWAIKEKGCSKSFVGYSMESFIDWIIDNEQTCIIFFHNLAWDLTFIIDYFLLNKSGKACHKPKFVFNQKKLGDNQISVFETATGNRVYNCEWKIRKKIKDKNKRFTIKFKCSANLLNSSIEKIGEALDIPKGKGYNYDTTKIFNDDNITEQEKKYVISDIEIADKALCNFETFLEIVQTKLKIPKDNMVNMLNNDTISSLSFKILKRSIYNNTSNKKDRIYSKLKIPYKEYQLAYNWFQGGLTQFNPKYMGSKMKGEYVYYDVNSMYPAQMIRPLPYGNLLNKKPKGEHIEVFEIYYFNFKQKKGFEHLSLIKNAKTIWNDNYNKSKIYLDRTQLDLRYLGKTSQPGILYLFKEEWEQLQKAYDFNIGDITIRYLKVAPYAKNYVDVIYKEKATASNVPYKNNCKLMLNTCYGKFGQRAQFEGIVFGDYNIDDIIEVNGKDKVIVGECLKNKYQYEDLKKYRFIDTEIKKKLPNAWVGGYITSMARAQLIKTIIDNKDIWCYCDTDSSIFDISKGKLKLDEVSEDIIGFWKRECPNQKFIKIQILGAKQYVLIDTNGKEKSAMSGINKIDELSEDIRDKILSGDIDEYELINGQKRKERIKGGIVLKEKNVKIKKGKL